MKPHDLGNYVCGPWKLNVYLMEGSTYIVIKGTKGKKEVTKKYIWEKIKSKMEGSL